MGNLSKKIKKTLAGMLAAGTIFVGGSEIALRTLMYFKPDKFVQMQYQNPIVQAQAGDKLVFAPDYFLGHKLPQNFIGEKDFVSYDEHEKEAKEENKLVILNGGDSSPSGWDGYVIEQNELLRKIGQECLLPFFRYLTYPDYLRKMVGDEFVVVNAGVQAYSSLQGLRALKKVVEEFKKRDVEIAYATFYFGNNDSSCNMNVEDKNLLPSEEDTFLNKVLEITYNYSALGRVLISQIRLYQENSKVKDTLEGQVITRVSVYDFCENMSQMVEYCKENGIEPIIILPPVRMHWFPGRRIKKEEKKLRDIYLDRSESKAIQELFLAERLYPYCLEKSKEKDYMTPRIKKVYENVLKAVARKYEIPLVETTIKNPSAEEEKKLFVDYCHPKGRMNEDLAKEISKVIQNHKP